MKKRNLLIVGAGGHGKMVADAAEQMDVWERICFLDDRYPKMQNVLHWDVIGSSDDARAHLDHFADVFVAIGTNDQRLMMMNEMESYGFQLATIIHPTAVISPYATVGEGSIIAAMSVIQTNCRLGKGIIVNTASSVDHDCQLDDGVHISPGARLAGSVQVGACSWVGIGASVIQNIAIGQHAIVGAGAVVIHDVPDGKKVMGVW